MPAWPDGDDDFVAVADEVQRHLIDPALIQVAAYQTMRKRATKRANGEGAV